MSLSKENPKSEAEFIESFNKFICFVIVLFAVLFYPSVFNTLFSFENINNEEKQLLTTVSIILVLFGIVYYLFRKKTPAFFSFLIFGVAFLVSIELVFRVSYNVFGSDEQISVMHKQSNWTYKYNTAYMGHPFTQFSGIPEQTLIGSKALKGTGTFNNYGFVGDNFHYYKPKDVFRIACLGESTTADGWPKFLESYLTENNHAGNCRFEVYNFAHAYWNSAHNFVNFSLNIRDFSPDMIIIHMGWNEEKIRNVSDTIFRGDYTHLLKSFEHPEIYDRYLIRISGMYRYFKFSYDKFPAWLTLGAVLQKNMTYQELNFNDLTELKPFERNIRSIINLAIADSIKVMIATLPHSTDKNIPLYYAYKNIDQCNDITKKFAIEYGTEFIDLDSLISGKYENIFTDLAHINDDGRALKAKYIGDEILKYAIVHPVELRHRNKGYNSTDGEHYYIERILQIPEWHNQIKEKAIKQGISVDSMMLLDARYMVQMDSVSFAN